MKPETKNEINQQSSSIYNFPNFQNFDSPTCSKWVPLQISEDASWQVHVDKVDTLALQYRPEQEIEKDGQRLRLLIDLAERCLVAR
jgi:hypothetical protein